MISIVIVTWNSKKVLEDCVSSLFALVPEKDFELILVDNDSQDKAYLDVYRHKPNVRVILNGGNLGFAKAVNIGFREASGEYFLALNPDMIFVSNPFPRLISELNKDPKIGVIGPLLHGTDGQPQVKYFYPTLPSISQFIIMRSLISVIPPFPALALRFFHARIGASGIYYVDQIPGAFLLFHRDLFGTAVLNEAYFIWMEDVDFCLQVHRRGLKVAVVADEKIIHIGGSSFKMWDAPLKLKVFTRSYLTYLRMNFGFVPYFTHVLVMVLNSLSFFLLFPRYYSRFGFNGMVKRLGLEKSLLSIILAHLRVLPGQGRAPLKMKNSFDG